jgi:hypothetical protein
MLLSIFCSIGKRDLQEGDCLAVSHKASRGISSCRSERIPPTLRASRLRSGPPPWARLAIMFDASRRHAGNGFVRASPGIRAEGPVRDHSSRKSANKLRIDAMLQSVACRQARNAPPGEEPAAYEAELKMWDERWQGLRMWFVGGSNGERSQSEQLRSRARAAIPQLLAAIIAINERRSGRSDRSADFKSLAHWFLDCDGDEDAHRLARAAFALNPARHYAENTAAADVTGVIPWHKAPSIVVPLRLRETGYSMPRGRLPHVHDRSASRKKLEAQVGEVKWTPDIGPNVKV